MQRQVFRMRFFAQDDSQLSLENTDTRLGKGIYVFFMAIGGARLGYFFENFQCVH